MFATEKALLRMVAYARGYQDSDIKMGILQNPYVRLSEEWEAWRIGYMDNIRVNLPSGAYSILR